LLLFGAIIKDLITKDLFISSNGEGEMFLHRLNHNLRASSTKLETASKELEQKVAELKESEEKYRSLFETANDAIFMVNLQGYISFANPKFFEVMGYRPDELEKLHFTHLVHPDDVSLVMNRFKRRLAGEEVETNYQFRALTKDKRIVYVDANFSLVKKEGEVTGIQAIVRDITQRKSLEKSLEEKINEMKVLYDTTRQVATSLNLDEVLSTIAQSSANLLRVDGVIIRLLDAGGKILEVVKVHNLKMDSLALRVQGVGEGVLGRVLLKGKPIAVEDVQKDPHYRDKEWAKKEGFISFLGVPLQGRKKIIGTLSFLSRRKRIFREEEVSLTLTFANQAAVAIENAKLYEENVKLSITDPLTGIYNSRYFYDSLRREINRATRYGGTTSVIMFDLDGFKNYNDLYGHQTGDYVLREVAQRMLPYCRQIDVLARYGGDEFIILLPQTDQGGGIKLGERIRLGLEEGLFTGKKRELGYKVTVSGSVITSPQDGDEVEDLMRKLDTLLYVAKWMGENTVYSSSTISLEFIQDQLLERVDQKDHYTRQHSERVANYATALARKMNLDEEQIELIRIASLVHDVGKVSIPEIVLNRPGKLNEEEWNLIRSHPRNSAEIIRLSPLPREIIPLILHHHERWDGTGYPQGLKGEEIPLGARIIGLADAYDAMSVERPYRRSLKPRELVEEIKKSAGSRFDPTLVEVFAKTISPKNQIFP